MFPNCFLWLQSRLARLEGSASIANLEPKGTACQASADLGNSEGFDYSFLSKYPTRKLRFESSVLFGDFRDKVYQKKLALAREGYSMDKAERIALVATLLGSASAQLDKDELTFAKTYLLELSNAACLSYLLPKPQHFQWLKAWMPKDENQSYEPFSRGVGAFDDVLHADFEKMAKCIVSSSMLRDAVQHVIAKVIFNAWHEAMTVIGTGADQGVADFVDGLFLQIASVKLSTMGAVFTDATAPTLDAAVLKSLAKLVTTTFKKQAPSEGPLAALHGLVQATAAKEAEKKKQPSIEKPPAANGGNGSGDVGTGSGSGRGDVGGNGGSGDGAKAKLTSSDLKVGDTVLCLAGKDKDLYNNMKSEVMTVNTSSLWIKLLEGPKQGEQLRRTYAQIARAPPSDAGEKRKAEIADTDSAASGDHAAKKTKAQQIFGSVPVDD